MRSLFRTTGLTLAFCIVVVLNLLLLRQNRDLKDQNQTAVKSAPSHLLYSEGDSVDVRGTYTYPGIGEVFAPRDALGNAKRAPMTLAIFLSSATDCSDRLSELAVLKKLNDSLVVRGQQSVAIVAQPDSERVQRLLDSAELNIPLVVDESNDDAESITLEQMGISQFNMPFKIVFDSNFTSVYMRGANNSAESQAQFERAVLRLSGLIYRGEL